MYYFGSEFISGVNVGFEHMSYKQIGRKGKGWILLGVCYFGYALGNVGLYMMAK